MFDAAYSTVGILLIIAVIIVAMRLYIGVM
jgi:hypothetical protein